MPESGYDLDALAWRLRGIVGEENVLVDEPMCEHTTFRIGGPADVYVIPDDPEEIRDVLRECTNAGVPYFVLGYGSDLLVSDEGCRGVIVALGDDLVGVTVEDDEMTCEAGVGLKEASEMACELGLSGLEFACGIPGSVGGACFMNAGAYGGSMADVLKCVRVLRTDDTQDTLGIDELDLGYRHSRIADEGMVVLSATFDLKRGNSEKIRQVMDELTRKREERQPLEFPSAGSTFKRPEGYFVGKLVTDAGLKGYQSGGAAVSKKHAGFVVNVGNATAADVHGFARRLLRLRLWLQLGFERQLGLEDQDWRLDLEFHRRSRQALR